MFICAIDARIFPNHREFQRVISSADCSLIDLSILLPAAPLVAIRDHARNLAGDPRFAFGTWKVEIFAGYTSAILLLCVAGLMVVWSVECLVSPQPIRYEEAIWVAGAGFAVNLLCAWILGGAHHLTGTTMITTVTIWTTITTITTATTT